MSEFEAKPPKAASPLELIERALDMHSGKTIALEDLREAFGDRSFGFLMLVGTIPSLIPIPGIGSAFGLLPLWFGVLMLLGKSEPWLPAFMLNYKLPRGMFQDFLKHARPYWDRIDDVIHPRFFFLFAPLALRVWGLIVIILSCFILFPGPLTNLLPSLAILGIAMAILTRDGLLALASLVWGIFSMALLIFIYGSLLLGMVLMVQKLLM